MKEEVFDVVNERDEVIGQAPRAEVHRRGLRHRAVHVLVFNAAGSVFLQKRSMTKDRQPGLWDSSASGHVDAGEDYDACAVRELREEIGLELKEVPKRLFKLAACAATDQEHVCPQQSALASSHLPVSCSSRTSFFWQSSTSSRMSLRAT